jgi:signal transduction histidine kinase
MFLLEQEAKQVGRMRAQMLEKEKMVAVGQIAAGVAHEIGNPLSSISSVVQMVKRKGSNAAIVQELDLIETHIQRISTTVRQLVNLARRGDDRWELVNIRQTLEETVRLIAFDRRARNVTIDLAPCNPLPQTYGLRGQLQQVFINLSLNALDAMPEGGKLTIQAKKPPGRIVVRVEDTGCGIPAEIGRRVFEPFFTTKQPGQGTGLGLAVSYGIVQKHGGEIEVNSAVGKGTVFTVELPVLDKPPDV